MDNADGHKGSLSKSCIMEIVEKRLKAAFSFVSLEDSLLYNNGNPFFRPPTVAAIPTSTSRLCNGNSGGGYQNQQRNNNDDFLYYYGKPFLPIPSLENWDGNARGSLWNQQRNNGDVLPSPPSPTCSCVSDDEITELIIFDRIMNDIFLLMTDQYEHHLFQRLIEKEDEKQLKIIVDRLIYPLKNIFHVSTHEYGACSMKKLIKVLKKSPLINEIVSALFHNFCDLMIDQTGRQVIFDCLNILDSQQLDPLYMEAINKFLQLATHEWGYISLTNLIDQIKGPRRTQILSLISDHVVFLAQDPYGTFVVQFCVMELQDSATAIDICSRLKGHFVKLSMQKTGSHLVEKCLRSSGMDYVVDEFVNSNMFYQVAKDQYGNYVVQTALKETKTRNTPVFESLVLELAKNVNHLQRGYGRNILTLIESYGELIVSKSVQKC